MSAVFGQCSVDIVHKSVNPVLHHVDVADEGRGLVWVVIRPAGRFGQSIEKESPDDHVGGYSTFLQSFACRE